MDETDGNEAKDENDAGGVEENRRSMRAATVRKEGI